jgi:DeoR family ulaG and ulaABCDEF operon transcriptional repressor
MADAKVAIGRAAAGLCQDGDKIIMSGGGTLFQMARFLAPRRMKIFTNSFPVAVHLMASSRNDVALAGGTLVPRDGMILNYFDDGGLEEFAGCHLFMSAGGICERGVLETDAIAARVQRLLLRLAGRVTVLLESAKYRSCSGYLTCPLDRIDTVITDDGVSDMNTTMLPRSGVSVLAVETGGEPGEGPLRRRSGRNSGATSR